mmetsp:Transcript_10897/g.36774  ORF Transcript_10897/g.36774 Transcript_10897/m.36774 type:complete len:208 (-) Transcript_10897:862-1485(-)
MLYLAAAAVLLFIMLRNCSLSTAMSSHDLSLSARASSLRACSSACCTLLFTPAASMASAVLVSAGSRLKRRGLTESRGSGAEDGDQSLQALLLQLPVSSSQQRHDFSTCAPPPPRWRRLRELGEEGRGSSLRACERWGGGGRQEGRDREGGGLGRTVRKGEKEMELNGRKKGGRKEYKVERRIKNAEDEEQAGRGGEAAGRGRWSGG